MSKYRIVIDTQLPGFNNVTIDFEAENDDKAKEVLRLAQKEMGSATLERLAVAPAPALWLKVPA